MKTKFITAFIVMFLFGIANSYSQDKAKIVFIRNTGFVAWLQTYKMFVNDQLATKLRSETYATYEVSAGKHTISSQLWGSKSKTNAHRISINVEAGKTYYVTSIFATNFWRNKIICQEVTESSAKSVLPYLVEDDIFTN